MFVYYFANVGRPCDEIRDRMMALDLAGWAEDAYRNAESLRSRLVDEPFEASTVAFHISDPIEKSNHAVLALRWSADRSSWLVLRSSGGSRCRSDWPESVPTQPARLIPSSTRGRPITFHRVTEACVKSFVDRVAGALGRSSVGELGRLDRQTQCDGGP